MSNYCPVPGCDRSKDEQDVMCKTHWRRVPKELRDRVWIEFRYKPGTPAHLRTVLDAIHSVHD